MIKDYNKLNRRVFITGMGVLTALADGVNAFKRTLQKGQSKFSLNSDFPELSFPVITAAIDQLNFEETLASPNPIASTIKTNALKAGRRAPKVIQASLLAVLEAYHQARLIERNLDSTRIGLIVAGHNTSQRYRHDLQSQFNEDLSYLPPTYALHFMDTDQIGVISEVFNIQGESFTVGGASASGNVALIQAYRLLQQGIIDIAVVVGVMADLAPMEIQGFFNIGAMGGRRFANQPELACRPFDKDHEGFIWGQSSGCLILEADDVAIKDQVILLGEIKGAAIALDAHRHTEPNYQGEARAMQQAISQAGISPAAIQYINTHGSSSAKGDEAEVMAIRTVFEKSAEQIWLNSTKGIVGHCLWSAGVIEAIATLIQLQEGFLHANLNLNNPIDPALRWVGQHAEPVAMQIALSNSFGFGGINSSIVLAKEN